MKSEQCKRHFGLPGAYAGQECPYCERVPTFGPPWRSARHIGTIVEMDRAAGTVRVVFDVPDDDVEVEA